MFLTFDWNVPPTVEDKTTTTQKTPSPETQSPALLHSTMGITTRRTPLRRTVIAVEVDATPEQGTAEEGTTWVAKEAPKHWLARSLIVRLTSQSVERGSGRLSMVTRLTRHWVSFKVHGVSPLTSLRIPIPWVKLGLVDQYKHLMRYATLSSNPPPPPGIGPTRNGQHDVTSPYEYDVEESDRYLKRQLSLRSGRGTRHD